MALSYFFNDRKDDAYVINKHNFHKFDENNILVTLDHGPWVLLGKGEFDLLRFHRVENDPNLFSLLLEKGVIVTEKNFNEVAGECRIKYGHIMRGIGLHIIAVTTRCNQNCIYCYTKSSSEERNCDMDEEAARAVVDFIFQSPSKDILIDFQGGEPLMNFEIIKFIVDYTKKKNNSYEPDDRGEYHGIKKISFSLITNMAFMNEEKADYIINNKIRLRTSLDGPKELHDKNRPRINGSSSYDDIIRWTDFFIERKKYRFFEGALPTITEFSLKYPEEIVDEYISRGFNSMAARPMSVAGMAKERWNNIGYDSEEFLEFWKKYFEYVMEINRKGKFFFDEDAMMIIKKATKSSICRNSCFNKPCGIGTIQCAYSYNGDIYTCDAARANKMFKIGNVKEDTYQKVFTSKAVADMIGLSSCTATLCDSCAWNAYCAVCIVNIYGSQGNLVPKLSMDFLCKVRGEQVRYIFKKMLFSNDRDLLMK